MFSQLMMGTVLDFHLLMDLVGGALLNLKYTFEQLFSVKSGQGYPKERLSREIRKFLMKLRRLLIQYYVCS